MILVRSHFYSASLGMQREMDVLLPDRLGQASRYADGDIPVLYLLHGWGGSHTDWQRMTNIERYAQEKGIAVVMPSTDLGFYADMKYGYDFYQFFHKELPEIVAEFFPALSRRRERTFVAGLSMGGFGALKLGILQPRRFAAVIGLSATIDLRHYGVDGGEVPQFAITFGTKAEVAGGINDLPYQLEQQLNQKQPLPKFFLACGLQDFTYEDNKAFVRQFDGRIDLCWNEEPGAHTWDFWDRWIAIALDWLPLDPFDCPQSLTKEE